jgi:hypothetical protein
VTVHLIKRPLKTCRLPLRLQRKMLLARADEVIE